LVLETLHGKCVGADINPQHPDVNDKMRQRILRVCLVVQLTGSYFQCNQRLPAAARRAENQTMPVIRLIALPNNLMLKIPWTARIDHAGDAGACGDANFPSRNRHNRMRPESATEIGASRILFIDLLYFA